MFRKVTPYIKNGRRAVKADDIDLTLVIVDPPRGPLLFGTPLLCMRIQVSPLLICCPFCQVTPVLSLLTSFFMSSNTREASSLWQKSYSWQTFSLVIWIFLVVKPGWASYKTTKRQKRKVVIRIMMTTTLRNTLYQYSICYKAVQVSMTNDDNI